MLRRQVDYSNYGKKIFIFLLLFFCVQYVNGSDGCRHLVFLDCIKNKTLVNHTIHTSNVLSPGLEQCQHECFMNDACVSYNLGPTLGMSRKCELSDTDHVGFPDHVVGKEGAEYCPIRSPCSSKSCPADLICKPDFSWDTFHCSCYISKPLGMEDGRIPDSVITASSVYSIGHEAFQGRLNYVAPSNLSHYSSSCWSAKINQVGEYLQVDLGEVFIITMVATQGRDSGANILQYVKSYTLKFSQNATSWIEYKEDRRIKHFQGNSDRTTVVIQKLAVSIEARFVRIVVQTWQGHISLRMELYGCKRPAFIY